MAHFYGEIQGSRGATTRCGTKNSGMDCHVRGWDVGARLKVTHKDGQDYIEVFVTSGSKAKTPDKLWGTIRLDSNETPEFISYQPSGTFKDSLDFCSDTSPCEYQVTEDGTPIHGVT